MEKELPMKRVILTALAAGVVALLPHPVPADAQSESWVKCIKEANESCQKDFPGDSYFAMSVRGYCIMIRSSICKVFDPRLA